MLLILLLMANGGDGLDCPTYPHKLAMKATFLATKPPLPLGPVVLTFWYKEEKKKKSPKKEGGMCFFGGIMAAVD